MEVGDHVHQASVGPGGDLGDRLDVNAVVLERDADGVDSKPIQQKQGAIVGRLLDDDSVPAIEQKPEEHRSRLQRAVGDHHLLGAYLVMLGDPFRQSRMPAAGSVGERPFPVGLQGARRRIPDRLGGKDVGARGAAREADRLFGHWRRQYRNGAILRRLGGEGRRPGD